MNYYATLFLFFVLAFIVFRLLVKRDYTNHRKLKLSSVLLEFGIWAMCFCFPYIYKPADWGWFWQYYEKTHPLVFFTSASLIIIGVIAVIFSMSYLGFRRSCGGDTNLLKVSGPYRFSRNPQIVACIPFVLGYVFLLPSWYDLGWLFLYAAIAHMMVITEEEHLKDVYGQDFEAYCQRVPRYLVV